VNPFNIADLGDSMSKFKAYDGETHDAAVECDARGRALRALHLQHDPEYGAPGGCRAAHAFARGVSDLRPAGWPHGATDAVGNFS
jgi:hypothetical protein